MKKKVKQKEKKFYLSNIIIIIMNTHPQFQLHNFLIVDAYVNVKNIVNKNSYSSY